LKLAANISIETWMAWAMADKAGIKRPIKQEYKAFHTL
jgi:hypothetical protein